MATIITENLRRPGHYVVSEANGYRSRDQGIVVSGAGKLLAGAVLGKITASGKYTLLNPAGADGSQTAVAILWGGVDATSADARATLSTRSCEVQAAVLVWPAGISDANKNAALANLKSAYGIVAR